MNCDEIETKYLALLSHSKTGPGLLIMVEVGVRVGFREI